MTATRGARVIHHIPGRVRVRLPQGRGNPAVLRELAEFVRSSGGVRRVEINPTTGSILVHYDPESPDEIRDLLHHTTEGGTGLDDIPELGEADELAEKIEKEAEFLAAHSDLARHLVNTVKALDHEVRVATGNAVDLKVLLPAGLAVWALLKAGAEVSTPLWVSLAIFSFNSFVALHGQTAVHVSSHEMRIDRPA